MSAITAAATATASTTTDINSEWNDLASAPSDITPIGVEFLGQKFRNMKFPQDNSKYRRSFQPKWCQTYNWIEYSIGSQKSMDKDQTFTSHAFKNWSDACSKNRGLDKHHKSKLHQNAVLDQIESQNRAERNKVISELLSDSTLEKRRYYVGSIIYIIILLSSRELAFRGSWDKEASEEDGIFNALFKYTLEEDEKLKKCHKVMPRNALYTSPIIQNELISVIAVYVRDKMVRKINKSQYLTLYADGTKDRNGIEVISIALPRQQT